MTTSKFALQSRIHWDHQEPDADRAARHTERPLGRPHESAPRAPAERTCSMTINSVHWSEVWIDGASTGRHTPFVDYEIACGTHQVCLAQLCWLVIMRRPM